MVRQRGALREARRAARVLDVDRVVELRRGLALGELVADTRSPPASSASQSSVSRNTTLLEVGQLAAHLGDHRDVVRALERARGDERPAARLAQRVLELASRGRPG